MLVKEYRIPLPLTVEEYRIAQLYMIAKKSRDETHGEGSGVEILVNEPYKDGPGGNGQYTHKIYHVGSHLPGWFKNLLPKSALTVEEEAWNAYPYTKTRYTCPFVEKFSLEIETYYFNDGGHQENVFQLNKAELSGRTVDLIDVVRDQLGIGDYLREEDPRIYVSQRTGRGPLNDDWIQDYWGECKGKKTPLANGKAIMCAYKLCKVEFRYWGMQSKIEKFIHDIALRKTMLRAHRQAWAWQDEWHGLAIDDIRRIEADTQRLLASKFGATEEAALPAPGGAADLPDRPAAEGADADARRRGWSRSSSRLTLHSPGSVSGKAELEAQLGNWRMESIRRDSVNGSSDDEFFDCEEEVVERTTLARWSSLELLSDPPGATKDELSASPGLLTSQPPEPVSSGSPQPGSAVGSCSFEILLLVLHSGSVLDAHTDRGTKRSDITTFRASVEAIVTQHYPALQGRLCIRLVPCPSMCAEAISVLTSLSPYSFTTPCSSGGGGGGSDQSPPSATDSLPIGAIPLLAAAAPDHREAVAQVASEMNRVYLEFVRSPAGAGFQGQVSIIADSIGSLLAYDVLSAGGDEDDHLAPPPSPGVSTFAACPSGELRPEPGLGGAATTDTEYDSDCPSREPRELRRCKSDVPARPAAAGEAGAARTLSDSEPITRHLSPRRPSGCSDHHWRLEFDVTDLFMFGAPLGLVLASRRMYLPEENRVPPRPACHNVYNLFHPTNPVACRLEPLLCSRFAAVPPATVCRYHKYPLGDGQPTHLLEFVQSNMQLLGEPSGGEERRAGGVFRRESAASVLSTMSGLDTLHLHTVNHMVQRWWGSKRIDYALYCPEGLASFPAQVLPHLFHASYWESQDAIAFILRNLLGGDQHSAGGDSRDGAAGALFSPAQPREKWIRKRTSVKIKNVTPNHRGNDVVVCEGVPQVLTARFTYGPIDMVSLTGEKVDIYYMAEPPGGDWLLLGTEVSDKSGRVTFTIPAAKALGYGLYPIKMVVRGDHTWCDFQLCVVPPQTECVVFSIDGSFTASMSVTGRDPKVRASSVDVVRHWQELGYLIIYVTGRPDMQRRKVLSWLSQHNFPHGLVSFADGLTTEPLKHKADYLRQLVEESRMIIHAGYGSSKDIAMYASVGLRPEQIHIVGKMSKKQQADFLVDGYVAHLAELTSVGGSRAAKGNARMVLPRGCFGLNPALTRRRTTLVHRPTWPAAGQSLPAPPASPGQQTLSPLPVPHRRFFWSAKRATSFPATSASSAGPTSPSLQQPSASEGLFSRRRLAPRGKTAR
ncbi:Protein retinal degeneration B [Amphibalanus amphitrite]|uniref:Protein retinal degeneration B n=1 Tax=Amphibalanus amphitrite TaxID=1232801 RepID=A0A6A4VSL4_AMPAM|nr:Protein retinal degeneration B [Amphibalanus amphitrite]KAF0299118.1 Protein retinal degeneration B [Amphibalanus amphitrite]